jgi:hypothetical protein
MLGLGSKPLWVEQLEIQMDKNQVQVRGRVRGRVRVRVRVEQLKTRMDKN